jgi:hypothetical protein
MESLYSDIVQYISQYLMEREIICLSRVSKYYYSVCNNYQTIKLHFNNLPFAMKYRNKPFDMIKQPLASFGYCKKWVKEFIFHETNMHEKVFSDAEILTDCTMITTKHYFIGQVSNNANMILDYDFTSKNPYSIGVMDLELFLVFGKIDGENIYSINYDITINTLRSSFNTHKAFIKNNKMIYSISFGSKIIPIIFTKNNNKFRVKLPNFVSPIKNAYVKMKEIILMSQNNIYKSIYTNGFFHRPYCIMHYLKSDLHTNFLSYHDNTKAKLLQLNFCFKNGNTIIKTPIFKKMIIHFKNGKNISYDHSNINHKNGTYDVYFVNKQINWRYCIYNHNWTNELYDQLLFADQINFIYESPIDDNICIHAYIMTLTYLLCKNNEQTKLLLDKKN